MGLLLNRKKKYIAVFVINQIDVPNIIKIKRFNPISNTIRFRKHSFVIDVKTPSYTRGLKLFYFFSLTVQKQIAFQDNEQPTVNTEVIDQVCNQKIVEQLTANLNDQLKPNLMMLLFGICIGAIIGYMYAQYTLSQATEPTEPAGMIMSLFNMIKLLRCF